MWKSTPLHRACQSGHADIVELLLRRGASTSAMDNIKHRPGQSFDNDVSSEQRQVRLLAFEGVVFASVLRTFILVYLRVTFAGDRLLFWSSSLLLLGVAALAGSYRSGASDLLGAHPPRPGQASARSIYHPSVGRPSSANRNDVSEANLLKQVAAPDLACVFPPTNTSPFTVQVIANLLEQSDMERSITVSGRGGPARSPTPAAAAWGRTRSVAASSTAGREGEGLQRTQSRYIPPAARAAAAAAAAAAEVGAAGDSNRPCPPGTDGTSSGGGGVQPWRRKASTMGGLPEDRGPDVDGDGYDTRGDDGGDNSSVATERAGDDSRGSAGFVDFRRGEENGEREEDEEEDESDDDEEMFELEMSTVVEAVEGRLRTGAETRA